MEMLWLSKGLWILKKKYTAFQMVKLKSGFLPANYCIQAFTRRGRNAYNRSRSFYGVDITDGIDRKLQSMKMFKRAGMTTRTRS